MKAKVREDFTKPIKIWQYGGEKYFKGNFSIRHCIMTIIIIRSRKRRRRVISIINNNVKKQKHYAGVQ